jgi:hypothetical protein
MSEMIQELKPESVSDIKHLVQSRIRHIGDSEFFELPADRALKWYSTGIAEGVLGMLASYDDSGNANGFLVHEINNYRTEVIFAEHDFAIEKLLLDVNFERFSPTAPYLLFESGYPTPWISQELSDYVETLGFASFPRQYMRLKRSDDISPVRLEGDLSLVQFSQSLLELVTALIYKSVDGTEDQELWPFVYGTYESTLSFHQRVFEGDFVHIPGF